MSWFGATVFAETLTGTPLCLHIQGTLVTRVVPGTRAAQEGLTAGDVIVGVHGRRLHDLNPEFVDCRTDALLKYLSTQGRPLVLNLNGIDAGSRAGSAGADAGAGTSGDARGVRGGDSNIESPVHIDRIG